MKNKLNTISEAVKAIKNGEIIIVVDAESRENDLNAACFEVKPDWFRPLNL